MGQIKMEKIYEKQVRHSSRITDSNHNLRIRMEGCAELFVQSLPTVKF
jgi:hypothetical protein